MTTCVYPAPGTSGAQRNVVGRRLVAHPITTLDRHLAGVSSDSTRLLTEFRRSTALERAQGRPRHQPRLDCPVSVMSRETTSAMYMIPVNDSSITSARAIGLTGMMSLSPTLERIATLQ